MITTIIFDLSEVYLRGLLGIEYYLEQNYNIKIDNSEWHDEYLQKLFHGEITEEEFWITIIRTHGWTVTVDDLKKTVRQNFKEIQGTRRLIEQLKENGYRLGLLSVHAREWIEHLEKEFDYHKLFDSVLYSFEVGISKPDRKAYQLILEQLKVKPDECIFIDDSIQNLEGAKLLGITTVLFENAEQLVKDLRSLNIRIGMPISPVG